MWNDLFESPAIWFTVPALVGTGLFALKLLLMLMGSSLDTDVGDAAHIPDFSGDHHTAADAGFKLLSIQGVLAFLMGFGWAGLTAITAKWSMPLVSAVAVAGGLAMTYLMAMLMASVFKLQATGNININSAVGVEGTVYVTIPADSQGQGQVSLVVNDHQRIYTAVSDVGELPRNARVRVIGVHGQSTLKVIPA